MNQYKLYRMLCRGVWYKIQYQLVSNTSFKLKFDTYTKWTRSKEKIGIGEFKILDKEDYT